MPRNETYNSTANEIAKEWLAETYPMLKVISINGPFIYNLLPDNIQQYIVLNWYHPPENNFGYYYEPEFYNNKKID